jgi:predicted helicase
MEHDPDPWLYFYEDFLAEYDPKMRDQYGVFFTPVEVVRSQVRLVGQLLTERFGKTMSYADEEVVFLDPAAGTGTYPLAAMTEAIEKVQTRYGVGAIPQRATILAMNVHAFELLVGPYSVAHLRVTQKLQEVGATLPDDGVHVYLTDTLESPDVAPPGRLPLSLRPLVDEHRRAGKVKKETRVLVCMGNPPYERQAFDASEGTDDNAARRDRLLGEFITLARGRTKFSHLASLYNKYVYFWRWALWKVFDSTEGPGIVSFITASSYLNGPGFLGMREVMRRTFDELWIIDLEGGNLGARKTENVFAIETPVAIAIGVRYGKPNPDQPANVRYAKITGTRREKLSKLDSIKSFNNLDWQECSTGWTASLIPSGRSIFSAWPLLTDLFPWQTPGVKVGRTWPIATTTDNAKKRWQTLAVSSPEERSTLFPDRRFGRKTTSDVGITNPPAASRERIIEITERSPIPLIIKYAHRSFDRKCILADPRIIDLQRPPLWFAHSEKQVYLTSLLTDRLGFGPAATVTSNIPDLHYFHGRGGKDIIPLWRNQLGTEANITAGLLNYLENVYGKPITPEDFFAYCYAILAGPEYTRHFANDLATSAPRIPISTNPAYFDYGVNLGRQLIWIHTYGTRFVPINEQPDTVLAGKTRAMRSVPVTIDGYPRDFSWDETTETLHVGDGTFAPVSRAVWDFEVSGLRPLRSWLGYRMKKPTGKKSSPLDEVRPDKWPAEYTEELLELLWVLEYTVNRSGELTAFFESVIQGEVMVAGFLPQPNEEQRKPPEIPRSVTRIPTEQLSFDK